MRDVINYCALSSDIGKLSVKGKTFIDNLKKRKGVGRSFI